MSLGIQYLSLFFLSINVVLAIKAFRKKADLKWFEILLAWSLFSQIVGRIMGISLGNNMPMLHLYTLFEFIFISLFYKKIIFDHLKIKKYFMPFLAFMVMIIICNSLFVESIMVHNVKAKGLTQVTIISYAIFYFFNRISNEIRKGDFYLNRINAAILMYYSGSLFIFIFANFLLEDLLIRSYFWRFNALLYLIFQILILIATWRLVFSNSKDSKMLNNQT